MPVPLLSVCTATVGRPSLTALALPSVRAEAPVDLVEVVVAVSPEAASRVRADLAALGGVEAVAVEVVAVAGGAGAKRNAAVAASTGEWLLFLDDDDSLAPGWWSAFREALDDPDLLLVSGRTAEVDHRGVPVGRSHHELGPLHGGGSATFLAGTYAVRRELFDAVGGFDPAFSSSENWELSIRLVREARRRGRTIHLLDAVVLHQRPSRAPADYRAAPVAELMLRKYAAELATMPDIRARYAAQAGVGWAREGDLAAARRYFAASLRHHPLDPASWARMALACIPPLARRRWPPYPPGLS